MSRSPLRRSRLIAAAALSLAGTVAVGAFTPATAGDCLAVSVEVYKNRQGWQHVTAEKQCVAPTPWNTTFEYGRWTKVDTGTVPAGTPTGVGAYVWIPAP